MSTSVLRSNRQRCVASTVAGFQCGDKTPDNNSETPLLHTNNNNEASSSIKKVTNNNNKEKKDKNITEKYCKKCCKKNINFTRTPIVEQAISSTSSIKYGSGAKRRIYSSSESETYANVNQQNSLNNTNDFKNKRSRYDIQTTRLTMRLRRKSADTFDTEKKSGRLFFTLIFKSIF